MGSISCPRCNVSLTEVAAGDTVVDVCKGGCGGIWFDERELKKFDEASEDPRPIIFDAAQATPSSKDSGPAVTCPRCQGTAILARRASGPDGKITIDQCLKCSGIWLDVGELEQYRSQFSTEAERQKAANSYIQPELDAILGTMEEDNKVKREETYQLKERLRYVQLVKQAISEIVVGIR